MIVDIALLEIDQATREELVEYYEMTVAVFAVDRPDAPAPSFEALIGRLSAAIPGVERVLAYVARVGGRVAGAVLVTLLSHEDADQAVVDVRVHPDRRRRGIGTALLRAVLPQLREAGRELVVSDGVTVGLAGERWARGLGATEVFRIVLQRLTVATADPALWDVPVPAGYRLERWVGSAPDELLDSLARARHAIGDSPIGESSHQWPAWTPQRVREVEVAAASRGIESWLVAAVHEASGEVAGLTEIMLLPDEPEMAFQQDTAVLAAHRGHGLGLAMKAAMLRWLLPQRPAIAHVGTGTGRVNTHMQRINLALGYRTVREMIEFEIPLADLATVV